MQEDTAQSETPEAVAAGGSSIPPTAPSVSEEITAVSTIDEIPPTVLFSAPADVASLVSVTQTLQRRQKPFIPKSSLKRPRPSSYLTLLPDLNPFTIPKTTSPKKAIKTITEKDQNHPPLLSNSLSFSSTSSPLSIPSVNCTSLEGPLLLPGASPPKSL